MNGPRHQLLLQSQNLWAKSLWHSILYSGFFHQGGRLKALATVGTSEAGLTPGPPSPNHLLYSIDCLAASRIALRAAKLLGKFGCVGVRGGPVSGDFLIHDTERLPLVGAQCARALPLAIA